jgi:hypothetical protein
MWPAILEALQFAREIWARLAPSRASDPEPPPPADPVDIARETSAYYAADGSRRAAERDGVTPSATRAKK